MLLNTDYILPAELTGYVREAAANQPANQFTLNRWLPERMIDDLSYRFDRGAGGLIEAASFRSYDAESPIGSRVGVTRVEGQLPPISRKVRLGEYDRLRQRRDPQLNIRNGLLNDAEKMTREVAARMELARGDALVNGSVTINENGVQVTASFGRSGSHTVTAGTNWSDTDDADPLADLLSWQDTYNDTNGVDPGAIVTSKTVLGYLLRNAALRTLAGPPGNPVSIVSRTQLDELLTAHGLPALYTYDAKVKLNGSATRVVAADKVLLLPAPGDPADPEGTELGATLWGTTAESLDPKYALTEADQPGIVAGVYDTEDPMALWTKAAGIGLPVLANPDLTFCADVA
jgi:Phage major capsid protein E